MIGDQKFNGLLLVGRHLDARHGAAGPFHGNARVVAAERALAYVVKQQREQQNGGIIDLGKKTGERREIGLRLARRAAMRSMATSVCSSTV